MKEGIQKKINLKFHLLNASLYYTNGCFKNLFIFNLITNLERNSIIRFELFID